MTGLIHQAYPPLTAAVFNAVHIDPDCRTVAWPGDIQLCRESLYEQLTGVGFTSPAASHA